MVPAPMALIEAVIPVAEPPELIILLNQAIAETWLPVHQEDVPMTLTAPQIEATSPVQAKLPAAEMGALLKHLQVEELAQVPVAQQPQAELHLQEDKEFTITIQEMLLRYLHLEKELLKQALIMLTLVQNIATKNIMIEIANRQNTLVPEIHRILPEE